MTAAPPTGLTREYLESVFATRPKTPKHCNGCGLTKARSEFYRKGTDTQSKCKKCQNEERYIRKSKAKKEGRASAAEAFVGPPTALEIYQKSPKGLEAGVTIAEYEARQGWPLFTIWPEAEFARAAKDPGRFLYVTASDEERKVLEVGNRGKRKSKEATT